MLQSYLSHVTLDGITITHPTMEILKDVSTILELPLSRIITIVESPGALDKIYVDMLGELRLAEPKSQAEVELYSCIVQAFYISGIVGHVIGVLKGIVELPNVQTVVERVCSLLSTRST